MKILLDTQVFIWLISEDSRLGKKSKKLLYSTNNQLYISYLSFFEMTIKASLGKLHFDPNIIDKLPNMGIELLDGDQKSLQSYQVFNQNNKYPFDNFLIATAKTHKLKLITSDHKILNLKNAGLQILNAHK